MLLSVFSWYVYISVSLEFKARNGISGSKEMRAFKFARLAQTIFQNSLPVYTMTSSVNICVHNVCQLLVLSDIIFFCLPIYWVYNAYLLVVLIYISMKNNASYYFFICLDSLFL